MRDVRWNPDGFLHGSVAMNGFLAELGKKAADRWLELLILPGLLWLGALVVSVRLGQRHALNAARMRLWIDQTAARPASHDLAAVLLVGVAALLGSAAVGLAVSGSAALVQRLWVLPGDLPPLSWLLSWRQKNWDAAAARLKTAIAAAAQPQRHGLDTNVAERHAQRAQYRLNRIGTTRPRRPTAIGDRFLQAGTHLRSSSGIDPDIMWPRLWSVLPDTFRADLASAQESYTNASRLVSWGLAYLVLAALWWPSAAVSVAVLLTAVARVRSAAVTLASLVETAVDLHLTTLAAALGISDTAPRAEIGAAIGNLLRALPATTSAPPLP
ncbi:hypothetical protein ABH935_005675 [Catenulispora sp. GAS73]